ncbi:HutD family protein [Noviherbaspirillum sp. CPCC 100848]|uniref:HutD family protein n=1 Tax=Noviherbaspirillum album TaxID=3080276 RepID=A0ABU6J5H9_9BURK|nr:HutD family protein [Noviherbaspirillum sp. CPCC 100848]MEC4718469.1 HutD family protein [Noviherbaspirillum sp. CPCC 100848]
MRKFTRDDYVSMPWKNGGGNTLQLAIAPEDADLSNFDWRVSTAEIGGAGPFSLFAGFDRSLAVLEGSGLMLELDSLHATILTPDNKPLAFRGEQQLHAALLDGPIRDLNVITRRACWTHTLEKLQFSGSLQCDMQADLIFIFHARGGDVHCRTLAGREAAIGGGESVLIDASDGEHIDLAATAAATLYIVRLMQKRNADNN